jgi:hypothetical protein
MIDFVRLNNRVVSAKSVSFTINGVPYQGITAADWDEKMDKEVVFDSDMSGGPVGITAGKYTPQPASLTMLKDVFTVKFLAQMALLSAVNLAPGSWGQPPPFPIAIQYVELPIPPILDLLSGCEIMGAKDTYAEGINAAVTVISFQPMSMSRNGLTLFNRVRGLL